MQERRAHTRRLMQEEAFLFDTTGSTRQPVLLLDVSRLGVSFTNPVYLESESVHKFAFCLPGNSQMHETVVSVVHSTTQGVPAGYRVGARFIEIDAHTTSVINKLVSALIVA